jgi:multidrug resistance efflux pump
VELEKMITYAGVDGRVNQFVLWVGDIVQPAPVTRAAGILIPNDAGEDKLFAGFNRFEAQVLKVGMAAEATCVTQPMTIIPLVVTRVQNVIATGQITATDQLTELQKIGHPGTVTVWLEMPIPTTMSGLHRKIPGRWRGSICISSQWPSCMR